MLAEAHREDRGAQRMLERLPGAEVRGQGQRTDDFGRADTTLASRGSRGAPFRLALHAAILHASARSQPAPRRSPRRQLELGP